MNSDTPRNRDIDRLLKSVVAPPVRGRVHQRHAQELLERIVATPRTIPASRAAATGMRSPSRHRMGGRRWAFAGAAAATVTALSVGLIAGAGGFADKAYASWTPDPAALPATDTQAIGSQCVRDTRQYFNAADAEFSGARTTLAERRGKYGYVYVDMGSWVVTCFRDGTGVIHAGSFLNQPIDPLHLGGSGVELQSWPGVTTPEGPCRLMVGRIGPDVVSIDIAVPHTGTVHATLNGGYFLAWYPQADPNADGTTLTLHLKGGGAVPNLSARTLMEKPYVG